MVDQIPTRETSVPVDFGGEAFLEAINNNNVEYLFINSGTDTFPIQEAMAKFQSEGKRIPREYLKSYYAPTSQPRLPLLTAILTLHENHKLY
jgi:hypothetical protein